ncbi:MAG: hypothetical protein HQ504_02385 [Rhodospirillaceae bacterium]|nr:hypothetical protein [Rhodospirillaceae bacterium]
MFGFSFFKLLFTIAAVVIVWQGFKMFNRQQEIRAAKPATRVHKETARSVPDAEDMVKCPVCETYVAQASAVSCGRDGCPYP